MAHCSKRSAPAYYCLCLHARRELGTAMERRWGPTVAEVAQSHEARLHAYCWLPLSLLLLVEVRRSALRPLARHIAQRCARDFNARAGRKGTLFHPVKTQLLAGRSAILTGLATVHLSPEWIGVVAVAEHYRLSSHSAYHAAGADASPPWLTRQVLLVQLESRGRPAAESYEALLEQERWAFARGRPPLAEGETRPPFAQDDILPWLRRRLADKGLHELIRAVGRGVNVRVRDLLSHTRSPRLAHARALIVMLALRHRIAAPRQIAQALCLTLPAMHELQTTYASIWSEGLPITLEDLLEGRRTPHLEAIRRL